MSPFSALKGYHPVSDLLTAIEKIEAAVTDARRGLPLPVFYLVSRLVPMTNVDLLVRDAENRVLLTWRADEFYGPGWHIPGGMIRFKERWEQRIEAVASSELGTAVSFEPDPMAIRQPIHPTRATRGHFISLLFDCRLTAPLDENRRAVEGAPRNGDWAWHRSSPPDLLEVHQRIYGPLLATLLRNS